METKYIANFGMSLQVLQHFSESEITFHQITFIWQEPVLDKQPMCS